MTRLEFLARLAQPADSRLVLLVLDGVGDLRSEAQPQTALERASLPNLDALAQRSALGRIVPAGAGVTPGSGPGHLALFGYDPTEPGADIGRGVLEALGMGLEIRRSDVTARGNFATADRDGNLTDRRAGRPSNEECRRLVALLNESLEGLARPAARVFAGEGHRFVLVLSGEGLSDALADTDPQTTGVPPLAPSGLAEGSESTVAAMAEIIGRMDNALAAEPQANRVLFRGFSRLPSLPAMPDLYQMRCGALAGYPLYRGVASACGMEVVATSKKPEELFATVREHWDAFDFFFLHIKQPDMAGEDGNLDAKVQALEEVDAALPLLLELEPDVLAVTGDHSTPAPLMAHSWHPVPTILFSDRCFRDDCNRYDEVAALHGHLGTFPSHDLLALMLANGGRLAKFGA